MMMILLCAVIGTLILVVQPARVRRLMMEVRGTNVGLALLGTTTQIIGLHTGARLGHALVVISMAALFGAAWSLRRWPGGWLLVLGIGLNAVAISMYGRMPITPAVMAQLDMAYAVGQIPAGSKDLVAQGTIATWLGDRFILSLPLLHVISVWSLGDVVLLSGICRTAAAKVPA